MQSRWRQDLRDSDGPRYQRKIDAAGRCKRLGPGSGGEHDHRRRKTLPLRRNAADPAVLDIDCCRLGEGLDDRRRWRKPL